MVDKKFSAKYAAGFYLLDGSFIIDADFATTTNFEFIIPITGCLALGWESRINKM